MRTQLNWNEDKIFTKDVLAILFAGSHAKKAAYILIQTMKDNNGIFTKNQMRQFAIKLDEGIDGVRYSYHNFYVHLLKKLLMMGFIQKGVPVWDDRRRQTLYCYRLNMFDIPSRPPSTGFWKYAWYIAKHWNQLIAPDRNYYTQKGSQHNL